VCIDREREREREARLRERVAKLERENEELRGYAGLERQGQSTNPHPDHPAMPVSIEDMSVSERVVPTTHHWGVQVLTTPPVQHERRFYVQSDILSVRARYGSLPLSMCDQVPSDTPYHQETHCMYVVHTPSGSEFYLMQRPSGQNGQHMARYEIGGANVYVQPFPGETLTAIIN
ncbi:hypothetical protein KIPB_012225, partial [Kipferlia bialata]